MNLVYDISTKDNSISPYSIFIDQTLDKLGFRKNTLGTKYLKELILYTYTNNIYNIFINRICKKYLLDKQLNTISETMFLDNIKYAIKNVDIYKFKNNFHKIFNTEYDIYYLSTKNIVILFVNILSNLQLD